MGSQKVFLDQVGAEFPIILGPMFPVSHPDLIGPVLRAGGMGVIQPMSFTFVHGFTLESGIARIREYSDRPFGINILLESGTERYYTRNLEWLDIALESGCTYVETALGKPGEIVKRARQAGAVVYHKVTHEKHARVAIDQGVDGLIAVNNRAGGHAGIYSAEELFQRLSRFNVPLVAAGGIGGPEAFCEMLRIGYAAALMGTRFIATTECTADEGYKNAIVRAEEQDIVLTERVTGVPLSVIRTEHIDRLGLKAQWWEKALMRSQRGKKLLRAFYAWMSGKSLKRAMNSSFSTRDVLQAGKSVAEIERIESVEAVMASFVAAAQREGLFE
jgi:nitronate monooxygenase